MSTKPPCINIAGAVNIVPTYYMQYYNATTYSLLIGRLIYLHGTEDRVEYCDIANGSSLGSLPWISLLVRQR